MGQLLGQGIASVYRAIVTASNVPDTPCGSEVAVKVSDTSSWSACEWKFARTEVDIMARLTHPNIVRYVSSSFTGGSKAVIVQELCPHKDLFDNIEQYGPMPTELAHHYFVQLAKAVGHMHSQCVAHRDLKLENIVFDADWNLKVCDFGHALQWRAGIGTPRSFQDVGTKRYQSPELHMVESSEKGYDPCLVDVWAAGIVFFELLMGFPPIKCANPQEDWYFWQISNDRWSTFWQKHEQMCRRHSLSGLYKMTPQMRSFFEQALEPNPLKRPTMTQLLQHPYLQTGPCGNGRSMEDVCATMDQRCA